MLPSFQSLDPRNLQRLRTERHADLKNELMMAILLHADWFVQYRSQLNAYRQQKTTPPPVYPNERVERVERIVDSLIREAIDPDYTR